jgi:hypothetical protein
MRVTVYLLWNAMLWRRPHLHLRPPRRAPADLHIGVLDVRLWHQLLVGVRAAIAAIRRAVLEASEADAAQTFTTRLTVIIEAARLRLLEAGASDRMIGGILRPRKLERRRMPRHRALAGHLRLGVRPP